ncbi:MAG: hypothetical protein ABSB66_17410, partial [Candidatus Acidiferrales bacterium]
GVRCEPESMRGGVPAALAGRSARPAGRSTRVTVGVLLGSTGVAHAGQNIAPSGNSRMHKEHFTRNFRFSRLALASYTLLLPCTQRIRHQINAQTGQVE